MQEFTYNASHTEDDGHKSFRLLQGFEAWFGGEETWSALTAAS